MQSWSFLLVVNHGRNGFFCSFYQFILYYIAGIEANVFGTCLHASSRSTPAQGATEDIEWAWYCIESMYWKLVYLPLNFSNKDYKWKRMCIHGHYHYFSHHVWLDPGAKNHDRKLCYLCVCSYNYSCSFSIVSSLKKWRHKSKYTIWQTHDK